MVSLLIGHFLTAALEMVVYLFIHIVNLTWLALVEVVRIHTVAGQKLGCPLLHQWPFP